MKWWSRTDAAHREGTAQRGTAGRTLTLGGSTSRRLAAVGIGCLLLLATASAADADTASPARSSQPRTSSPAPAAPAPAATPAPPPDNRHHIYVLDGFGGVHPADSSPALSFAAYWSGWDIARGLALFADGTGGYVVDGWGGVHAVGSAPAVSPSAYWPGWDIARGIYLAPWADATHPAGWVLDGWGGIHPFGGAPAIPLPAYWRGWDIARAMTVLPGQADSPVQGYVLDGWGGIHPFGGAPAVALSAYWSGWDIARGIDIVPGTTSGYVLDGWGGLHPFGGAPQVGANGYWPGWDIAHGLLSWTGAAQSAPGGWVLDGWGGLHPYGSAPAIGLGGYWPGWDIARGLGGPSTGSSFRTPDTRVLSINAVRQIHALDCEAAALQMALSYRGVNASQDTILGSMPSDPRYGYRDGFGLLHWGDPYTGFVGDVNGSEGSLTGYGVYYPPIARAAQSLGGSVVASGQRIAPADIYRAVVAGHPSVVWVSASWRYQGTELGLAFDGASVPYGVGFEHAVTVVGVNPGSVLVNNPLSGAQWISKSTFESSFTTFDNMAVIVV